MATLVAFASLPFGLRGGEYQIKTSAPQPIRVHISELRYNPFLTITSRPELAQSIPASGQGPGLTSYTWYDHPFVLRVLFGRNVASLGSINSCATILQPLPDDLDWRDPAVLGPVRERFALVSLEALNNLIGVVRRKAHLYHIYDLRRDELHITVRREDGAILEEDPLQAALTEEEAQEDDRFDLVGQGEEWYRELNEALQDPEPIGLADGLLMEAERALAQRFPRQVITTCHTCVETAASLLLTKGMTRRQIPDREIDQILSTKSLTSKLDGLLRTYAGYSLKHDNHVLWRAFNVLNDMRNDIVHRGKRPTVEEAQEAIEITRQILRWLDWVRSRNKLER